MSSHEFFFFLLLRKTALHSSSLNSFNPLMSGGLFVYTKRPPDIKGLKEGHPVTFLFPPGIKGLKEFLISFQKIPGKTYVVNL